MMDSTAPLGRALRRAAFLLVAVCTVPAAHAFNHDRVVPPIAPGRLPVACSNVAQDASRIAPGLTASDYWEGKSDHYVNELLTAPRTALQFLVNVPDNGELFANHRGQLVPFVAFACWPTTPTNSDPSYALPGSSRIVPHMQPAGTTPKFMNHEEFAALGGPPWDFNEDFAKQFPLIVFSHGLGGSPIDDGYIDAVVQLASQGFVVAAPFHGDARFSRLRIEDLSDFFYLLRNFSNVVEMQMMRPLTLKAMVDLLASSDLRFAIDPDRIGGFGASLGGEAMAMLLGSKLTTTIGGHCSDAIVDPRIRAAVGYVPFAGYSFLPAFCEGNSGASSVNRPYLAISGTADTTAPIGPMQAAVSRFSGTKYLVEFIDGQHELRPEDAPTLFTWTVTFLRAYLQDTAHPEAIGQFVRMNSVNGGGRANEMLVDVHLPFTPATGIRRTALEFYSPTLNHFFTTADPNEIVAMQRGDFGSSWIGTGLGFNIEYVLPLSPPPAGAPPRPGVCRFRLGFRDATYAFYTADATECDIVKRNPAWRYQGVSFYAVPASGGTCPDGFIGVHRAYNNGILDANHRYTTSDSTMRDMQAAGWKFEGTMFCALP